MTDENAVTDAPDHLPMRASPSIDALVAALAQAQGAFGPIEKTRTGRIATKAGASIAYRFADLSDVLVAVRPPLAQHELALLQPVVVDGSTVRVATVLAHGGSGQWVATELAIPVADATDARSVASAISYGRRYGVVCLLALAPSEDDDDAAAAVAKPVSVSERSMPPKSSAAASATAEPISASDRKKLFELARARGWSETAFKEWLAAHGVASTQHLSRARYDALVVELSMASAPERNDQAAVSPPVA